MTTFAGPGETLEIVKQYRLLYRSAGGSVTYETVMAEGSELLTINPDGSKFSHMIVGFCSPCLMARLEGKPGCDWPECSGRDRPAPRDYRAPVHDPLG
jgi:hypothetical protein